MDNNQEPHYKGKAAEMLLASSIIVDSAIAHVDFLMSKRATWTPEFFDALKVRIGTAITTYLGVDGAKALRTATGNVKSLFKTATDNLTTVKLAIEEDFKATPARRDEILTLLGFNAYWKRVVAKDQEGLISLLSHFKSNLSEALKTEISAKGTPASTLTDIADAAAPLTAANIAQEGLKGTKGEGSDEARAEFNGIYDAVITVCKLSYNFFKGNPTVQKQFSYSKVLSNMNHQPGVAATGGGGNFPGS